MVGSLEAFGEDVKFASFSILFTLFVEISPVLGIWLLHALVFHKYNLFGLIYVHL